MWTSVPDIFARSVAADTSGTGTKNIGDVIDTGGDGINDVNDLYLEFSVDTTFTSASGAATVQFQLVSSASTTVSTSGGATIHALSPVYSVGSSQPVWQTKVGTRLFTVELPKDTFLRYLGVQTVIGGEALTAGKINAFLTPAPSTYKNFPAGI